MYICLFDQSFYSLDLHTESTYSVLSIDSVHVFMSKVENREIKYIYQDSCNIVSNSARRWKGEGYIIFVIDIVMHSCRSRVNCTLGSCGD